MGPPPTVPGDGWATSPTNRRVRMAEDEQSLLVKEDLSSLGQGPAFSAAASGAAVQQQQQTVNTSTNVILLFRLHNLQWMSNANFTLAILALLYAATNVVLFILNFGDHNDDDCGDPRDLAIARCGSATSDLIFHRLEFWATFLFALVTAFALMYTPKAQNNIYDKPLLLKLVLLCEICFAAVPAALVTVNLERYEMPCHELEYVNELTISFVDIILLASLLRLPPEDDENGDDDDLGDLEAAVGKNPFHLPRRRSLSDDDAAECHHQGLQGGQEQLRLEEDDDEEEEDPPTHPEDSDAAVAAKAKKDNGEKQKKVTIVAGLETTGLFPPSRRTSEASLPMQKDDDDAPLNPSPPLSRSKIPFVGSVVAGIQLVIYNSYPWYDHAERTAHFFEFAFGILSSFVTFWFCMDNRFEAEKEIMLILYGNHRDCENCRCEKLMNNTVPPKKRQNSVAMSIRRGLARTFSTVNNNNNTSRRFSTFELQSRRGSTYSTVGGHPYSYDACGTTSKAYPQY